MQFNISQTTHPVTDSYRSSHLAHSYETALLRVLGEMCGPRAIADVSCILRKVRQVN